MMQLTRRVQILVLAATFGGLIASASGAQSRARARASLVARASIDRSGRPQELRGSRESVELMYARAVAENLNFLKTPDDVYQAAMSRRLKLISVTDDVALDRVQFPFVLPQTLDFITKLAAQYHAQCGERLIVTSGARPLDKQPRNAVAESVHPTGMAVDFHRPAQPCVTWLRKALVELEDEGVIEATEERHPPHFHVAVLDRSPRQYAVNVDLKGMKPRPRVEVVSGGEVARADSAGDAKDSLSASAAISGRGDSSATVSGDTAAAEPTKRNGASDSNAADSESAKAHRVEPGDNLWTIAQRNHTTVKRLQELNNLRTTKLRTGQQLRLP
jgi:LysM repeat protein